MSTLCLLLSCVVVLFALLAWPVAEYDLLNQTRRIILPSGRTPIPPYDAIIVLGYGILPTGEPSTVLTERLHRAEGLLLNNYSQNVLLSGGYDAPGLPSEAQSMATWLSSRNASAALGRWHGRMLLENNSTSTRSNAIFSLKMVAEERWCRLLLVTSAFHQWRAERVFKRAAHDLSDWFTCELTIDTADMTPRPESFSSNALTDFDFIRELFAIAYYWLRRWI